VEVRDEAGLSRALAEERRAAVLFYATWCPFSRAFLPIFRKGFGRSGWRPIEAIIDDEENPLWEKYGIEVVPTVIFFEEGRIVLRLDGIPGKGLSSEELERAMEKLKSKSR